MNLTQIEYFVKVAQLGSMAAVAKESYVSHPAVSKAINLFEEEIGVVLFYRVPSGCILTDSGEIVYNFAVEMLKNKDNILNSGSLMDPLGTGSVKLMTAKTQLLPNINEEMLSIKKQFPNTNFSVSAACAESILASLKIGDANMGIFLAGEEQARQLEKEFHVSKLCGCAVVIACDKKNALAAKKSLQGHMLTSSSVIADSDSYFTHFIDENITDSYHILYDTDNALMRFGAVENSDNICFTTDIEYEGYSRLMGDKALKTVPVCSADIPIAMEYISVCSKKYPVSPLVNFFISSLKDSFRRLECNGNRRK